MATRKAPLAKAKKTRKTARTERGSLRQNARLFLPKSKFHTGFLALVLVLAISVGGYVVVRFTQAATCTVSATLVNSCRPWIGAAVTGDPNAAADKISQFGYLEKIVGRSLDLFHDYHPPGSDPVSSDEAHYAGRSNTYDYINWKPAGDWASASGGNASANANIKKAADSIKATGHKVFLTVWHEPENDVSAFDNSAEQTACNNSPKFKGLKGGAGTPAQYRAMWQNVRNIFNNDGVTNVVWVVNYQGYAPFDCLKAPLYPGNSLVDWVTFEAYGNDNASIKSVIDNEYSNFTAISDATHNFTSKPWGIGEFGTCNVTSDATAASYYQQLKSAIDNNTYPRLKMYMVYDDTGNNAGPGCLVDRNASTLSAFKSLVNDPVFSSSTVTSTPTPTPTPSRTPTPTPKPTSTPTPTPTHTPTPTPKPSPTPTPAPAVSSVTLGTSSDTYVDSSSPNTTFGDATALRASAINNRALLRFKTTGAVPSGKAVTSVKLRLYVLSNAVNTGGIEVHPESTNFVAADVTWNTQPAWISTVLATSLTPSAGSWVTITLPTSALNLSGDTTLGLRYTTDNAGFKISSREDASHGEQLIVQYQ